MIMKFNQSTNKAFNRQVKMNSLFKPGELAQLNDKTQLGIREKDREFPGQLMLLGPYDAGTLVTILETDDQTFKVFVFVDGQIGWAWGDELTHVAT